MKLGSGVAAVVSGGASGLGEAAARRLAAEGVKVAIFDLNDTAGESLAKEIGGTYCNVDVANDASVADGFRRARESNGQERILVACAGIVRSAKTAGRSKDGSIRTFPAETFASVIQVNLIGTFNCISQSAGGMITLPRLADDERGVIIATGSIAATDGQIGQAAYSASKAGVVGMTLPIARDLSSEGIRANTILPGLFQTPMMASLPSEVQESLGNSIPCPKRLGQPSEYASLVVEICRNAYLNGEAIRLDGAVRLTPR